MIKRTIPILLLLDLPPPLHGMSAINKAFVEQAVTEIGPVKVINTVPNYASSLWGTKYWFFFKAIHTVWCLFQLVYRLLRLRKCIVYRPINGGSGQIYDLLFLLVARLFRNKIYIHHHSFQYINKKKKLFQLISFVSGSNTTHIVLGRCMGFKLQRLYRIVTGRIIVLSNVAFFSPANFVKEHGEHEPLTIGHLANLCIDKGVNDFINICLALEAKGVNFKAIIAGPFSDSNVKTLVTNAVKNIEGLSYIGPVYSNAKKVFFSSLDIFVFPTRYVNEAEPLVLYEAGQSGALNIGTQRGCMADVISNLKGKSFVECDSMIENMVDYIVSMNIDELRTSQIDRLKAFQQTSSKGKESLINLLNLMKE